MKTIILIGNKGSFLNDVKTSFASTADTFVIEVNSSRYVNVINALNSILDSEKIDSIVFMGGEVRNQDAMFFNNFILPKQILDALKNKNIHFVYLSTMSVFEGFIIDGDFESPKTTYGYTKKIFDRYVDKHYTNFYRIHPASIITDTRFGSVDKYLGLLRKVKILRRFVFPGVITYIHRDDVVKKLVSVVDQSLIGSAVLMNEIKLSDIRSFLYGEPSFSVSLPKGLLRLFAGLYPPLAGKLTALFFRNYVPNICVESGQSIKLEKIANERK